MWIILSVAHCVHWYIMHAIMKYILLLDAHASDLPGTIIPDMGVLLFLNHGLALVLLFLFKTLGTTFFTFRSSISYVWHVVCRWMTASRC